MQIITTICDRHHADGANPPVEATTTVTLMLNRRAVEFDPCGECLDELSTLLEPWFEIGRRPGRPTNPVPVSSNTESAARSRRSFTPEFKADVVARFNRGGTSIAQLAQELDLVETVVRGWIKRAEEDAPQQSAEPRSGGERDGFIFCRYHDGEEDCMRPFERTQARSMHERNGHGFFFNNLSVSEQKRLMKLHMGKVDSLVSA